MQMHSSEFLKYAYELGAAQALADFEKDAGARELAEALSRHFRAGLAGAAAGAKNVWTNPTVLRATHEFSRGVGRNPSSPTGAMISGTLGVVGGLAPKYRGWADAANVVL